MGRAGDVHNVRTNNSLMLTNVSGQSAENKVRVDDENCRNTQPGEIVVIFVTLYGQNIASDESMIASRCHFLVFLIYLTMNNILFERK